MQQFSEPKAEMNHNGLDETHASDEETLFFAVSVRNKVCKDEEIVTKQIMDYCTKFIAIHIYLYKT